MCDPISIAIAGVTVGGAVAKHVGKKKSAAAERAAANRDFLAQVVDIQARLREEETATEIQKQDVVREGIESAATARASAGESGVSGLSVDLLLGSIEGQVGTARSRLDLQQDFITSQLRREEEAAEAQRQGRVNTRGRGPGLSSLLFGAASGVVEGVTRSIGRNQPSGESKANN